MRFKTPMFLLFGYRSKSQPSEKYQNKTIFYLHVFVETVHAGDPRPDARYKLLLDVQHHLIQLPLPLSPGPVLWLVRIKSDIAPIGHYVTHPRPGPSDVAAVAVILAPRIHQHQLPRPHGGCGGDVVNNLQQQYLVIHRTFRWGHGVITLSVCIAEIRLMQINCHTNFGDSFAHSPLHCFPPPPLGDRRGDTPPPSGRCAPLWPGPVIGQDVITQQRYDWSPGPPWSSSASWWWPSWWPPPRSRRSPASGRPPPGTWSPACHGGLAWGLRKIKYSLLSISITHLGDSIKLIFFISCRKLRTVLWVSVFLGSR